MFQFFTDLKVDWMGLRKPLVFISVAVLMAGLASAIGRQMSEGGTDAFNLGVDFKGGTVLTVKFREKPPSDQVRSALNNVGLSEVVIQDSTDKVDEILIKIPIVEGKQQPASPATNDASEASETDNQNTANPQAEITGTTQVDIGRETVRNGLKSFGKEAEPTLELDQDAEAAFKIVGTDSVGPIAGAQLRDAAVIATLMGMIGMLLFIAVRYDWTYSAGAVVAVFHDVLVTLAFFSIFQWEVSLTVLAAMLTLVGFSVNDSIVIFDRIRENIGRHRGESLYKLVNLSINQTMSRTVITNGLTLLAVLALVLFGGEVLRGFSLALLVGAIAGTYSTIAIASPIAIWWQSKIGRAEMKDVQSKGGGSEKLATASRRSVSRRPVTR